MPSAAEIHAQLAVIANAHSVVAQGWHALVAAAVVALLCGWRPTRLQAALGISLLLASVAAFAALHGNPFNTALLSGGAAGVLVAAARAPPRRLQAAPRGERLTGAVLLAFGWIYPHFLVAGSPFDYLHAAPLGLVPCPSLAVAIGLALLAAGLPRAVDALLAGLGLFYAVFGALVLGVWLDAGLALGAVVLLARLRRPAIG